MKKRRKYTAELKSKVALEAQREQQRIHEIAKRHELHPSQVTQWKKLLLEEDRLYKQIGQLQVEVDFLKDSCDKLGVTIPEDELR